MINLGFSNYSRDIRQKQSELSTCSHARPCTKNLILYKLYDLKPRVVFLVLFFHPREDGGPDSHKKLPSFKYSSSYK